MKETTRSILRDLKSHRESAVFYTLTFAPGNLSSDVQGQLEDYLKARFLNWWDSWIVPNLSELERRHVKSRKSESTP